MESQDDARFQSLKWEIDEPKPTTGFCYENLTSYQPDYWEDFVKGSFWMEEEPQRVLMKAIKILLDERYDARIIHRTVKVPYVAVHLFEPSSNRFVARIAPYKTSVSLYLPPNTDTSGYDHLVKNRDVHGISHPVRVQLRRTRDVEAILPLIREAGKALSLNGAMKDHIIPTEEVS